MSEKSVEALKAFLDGVESGICSARQILGEKQKETFDLNLNDLVWEKVEGKDYEVCYPSTPIQPTFAKIVEVINLKEGKPAYFKPYTVWMWGYEGPLKGCLCRKIPQKK